MAHNARAEQAARKRMTNAVCVSRLCSSEMLCGATIGRMIDAIVYFYGAEIEWVDAFQTAHVVSELVWATSALVVGVYAADRAEVVLCRVRIELVEPQLVMSLHNSQSCQWHRCHNGALAPADRAIAVPWVDDAIWECQ